MQWLNSFVNILRAAFHSAAAAAADDDDDDDDDSFPLWTVYQSVSTRPFTQKQIKQLSNPCTMKI